MKTDIKIHFTLIHRILHWIMAFAMPVLFITGFLRMYWMNKKHIIGIIESKTDLLAKEQSMEIAKSILEPMWQWHEVFAHIMIFSFLVRIIYMLVKGIRFPNPFKSNQPLKERLQGFTYVYCYLFVFFFSRYRYLYWKRIFSAMERRYWNRSQMGHLLVPDFYSFAFDRNNNRWIIQ